MIGKLLNIDGQVTTMIGNFFPHNIFFDNLFSLLSVQGFYIIIWLAALFYLFFIEGRKNKKVILYFFGSFIFTILLINVLKNIVDRPRPWTLLPPQDVRCAESDFSFPSAHAAGAFSGATILAAYNKKRRYLYFLVAGLVGLSRIYWQCHYLLDIISGASLGYLISYLSLKLTSHSIATQKDTKK